MCSLATWLVIRLACRGEEGPSLASSSPSHKWAECTEDRKERTSYLFNETTEVRCVKINCISPGYGAKWKLFELQHFKQLWQFLGNYLSDYKIERKIKLERCS